MQSAQDALDLADLRELAEAGRARVDVVLLTLAEVSAERKALLAQLADTTEDAGRGGGGDEKEYRRRETTLDDELASQQDDATAMLERLETLETHPQNVMGSEGLARGVAGCLVVYCAGCALKIEARLQRVAEAFSYSLERPFVGMFTYGEQFRTRAGANQHANLMYAVLAFGD